MTSEIVKPNITVPYRGTLSNIFSPETATFIGASLTRRQLQQSADIGTEWGQVALNYLQGSGESPLRIEFYTGQISVAETRASSILGHYAFCQYLQNNTLTTYDERRARYSSSSIAPGDSLPPTADIALYKVDDYHDVDGVAGVTSYLSSELKRAHDEKRLILSAGAVISAERLVAGA